MDIDKGFPVKAYGMTDMDLLNQDSGKIGYSVFIPEKLSVVLGKGSDPERSVKWDHTDRDQVEVFKRPSGGETVVISENTIVIGIVKRGEKFRNPSVYFDRYNDLIIRALSGLGIRGLNKRGFSDICIGEKKILGSSIYRTGDRVFYHAVLNVSEPVETIEKYLHHPAREPEYRQKRTHTEFVTSLSIEGFLFSLDRIKGAILSQLAGLRHG